MSSVIRLLLTGAAGRMGREIAGLVAQDSTFEIVAAVDRAGKNGAQALPGLSSNQAHVVIDFSSPEFFRQTLKWCQESKTPLVSGTTGLTAKDFSSLDEAGRQIPVLWAANMSLGVAVLTEALKTLKPVAPHFEFQIEEFHHKHKVDNPSGTALHLQKHLQASVQKELPEPVGLRGGGIFGVHKVWAMGEEEVLLFEHTALNRRVFARGALTAARWLVDRTPGRYAIRDVLGLE